MAVGEWTPWTPTTW